MRRPATAAELRERRAAAAALLRAISVKGGTNEAAARWMDISDGTLAGWVSAKHRMNFEVVFACPQLGKLFRRFLCSEKHHDSLPGHVASERRGSK